KPDQLRRPAELESFSFIARMFVGPPGSPGEESFGVVVCSPQWFAARCREVGLYGARHHLVVDVEQFDERRPAAAGALPGLGPRPVHWGEPGPHLGLGGHRSAWRMNVATATGLAMNAVCEPSMVSVVAPIRCAMNRSASGEIALSCPETRNQDG